MTKYFVLLSIVLGLGTAQAKVIERIAAIVNDEIITMSDIQRFKKDLKNDSTLVDEALLKLTSRSELLKKQSSLIDHLINEKIIDSEIKKNNLEVTIERVERELRSIAEKNGITRTQLKQAIAREGVKFSDYQNFVKKSLERQALIEREVSSKIKISDDEIFEYYAKTEGRGKNQVYQYELAHIIFSTANGGENAALDRAELVYKKIQAGDDFNSLASKFSEDPDFTQGGILGTFALSEMSKPLADAVKKIDEGETSKIIQLGRDFHIIKVNSKKLMPNPEALKHKARIASLLFEQAFKQQFKNWLERKRQESFIKVNI